MGALEFGIAFAKRFEFPDSLNNKTLAQQGFYCLVEKGGDMSNFYTKDLELFQMISF